MLALTSVPMDKIHCCAVGCNAFWKQQIIWLVPENLLYSKFAVHTRVHCVHMHSHIIMYMYHVVIPEPHCYKFSYIIYNLYSHMSYYFNVLQDTRNFI